MKVLFNNHTPFNLAHGGAQIQIEETLQALNAIGVSAEPLRWWDDQQRGEILHHFSRVPPGLAGLAHSKGMRVVMSPFMSGPGSRPAWQRSLHKIFMRIVPPLLPAQVSHAMGWESFQCADAYIMMTEWEAHLARDIFRTPRERLHVVPNGVETIFFETPKAERGPWLVCTATIAEVKRVVELAEAAVAAQVPVWFIGKPYSQTSPYAARFLELAQKTPQFVRYEGPIPDRAKLARLYREARGFVMLSAWESLSLSALEAAACECPLLLSDLPWARTTFGNNASYCPLTTATQRSAECLRKFYDDAPTLPPPPKPLTWIEVAQQLKGIYERTLNTSR